MKSRKKVMLVLMSVLVLALIVLAILIIKKPRLIVYNTENETIYLKNRSQMLLDNVLTPTIIENNKILAVFKGQEPLIGIYDITSEEITVVVHIADINNVMGNDIKIEEIMNLQYVEGERTLISFIIDKTLYAYDIDSNCISKIWEFTGEVAPKAYCWLGVSKILMMDEQKILNDWSLLLLDVETEVVTVVDTMVSAFDVRDEEIVYGKKYYMGSWCEWELHFMNKDLNQTKESERSLFWSIEGVVCEENGDVYITSGHSGVVGKHNTEIYKVTYSLFRKKKIASINSDEMLLKVK